MGGPLRSLSGRLPLRVKVPEWDKELGRILVSFGAIVFVVLWVGSRVIGWVIAGFFPSDEPPLKSDRSSNKALSGAAVALLLSGAAEAHQVSESRLWQCQIQQQINPGADGKFEDGNLLGLIAAAGKKPTFTFDPVSGLLRFSFWEDTVLEMEIKDHSEGSNSLKALRDKGGEIAYLAIETWREPHVVVLINGYQDLYIGTCEQ